jgi:hypothetical protein
MDVFDKVVPDVNPRQWPKSLVKQWKHTCILGLLVGNAADCRSEHRPACSIDNRDLLPCSHAPMLPCCALLSDRVSVHFVYLALLHGKI